MKEKNEKMVLKRIKSGYSFLKSDHLIVTQNVYKQFKSASYIELPK